MSHDDYIYAGVFPRPHWDFSFGHGVWRGHVYPDSAWAPLGLDAFEVCSIWVSPHAPATRFEAHVRQ